MPKIVFIEHSGTEHVVEAEVGRSVMQAATDNFVPGIVGDCGGCCSCATCHGFVDDRWLSKIPAIQAGERSLLEGLLDTQSNSRLTCQIEITDGLDGLVVRLPLSQF
ncbi:MAG TPA: 2Fe-2S ferredoxin [Steroidobacteraceae bacterium]|jgi:2Fe-2S ferredoxin